MPADRIFCIHQRNAVCYQNITQGYAKSHQGISDVMAFEAGGWY